MAAVNEGEGVVEWAPGVRWGKAALAGLITGAILLVIPWGSPWAGITFTSPVIMGRAVPPQVGLSYFEAALLHFAICVAYALVVAAIVNTFRPDRALLTGALVGLGLYGLNFLVFRLLFPAMTGLEWPVGFAHVVFGLLTSALYRGIAKRRAPDTPRDWPD